MACGCWTNIHPFPEGAMVKLESIVSGKGLKGLLSQDRDMLRELVREVVQQNTFTN